MDSSKLEDLHSKLDRLALTSLDIVEQLLKERERLELCVRDGYFEITRARHVMSPTAVSALQLPSADSDRTVRALVKVDRNVESDELIQDVQLVLSRETGDATEQNVSNDVNQEDGLRQRPTKSNPNEQESNLNSKNFKKLSGKDDPLQWFGVLVPQSLRNCQQNFCAATKSVCKIASLQTNLETVQKQYRHLKKELELLTDGEQ